MAWMEKNNVKHTGSEKATGKDSDNVVQKDSMNTAYRIDWMVIPTEGDDAGMVEKMEKTPEGFLKGRAIVTNVGVFSYKRPDGTTVRELRPPEEVFKQESMDSLKMVPITNDHPDKLLDCENVKDHQVGHTGEEIRRDGYHLSIPLKITDAKTVEDAKAGKQALSCGYSVDLEDKQGNWMGVPYDAIQRNIRYNHLAVVDEARAGDAAKLKMDSAVCFDSYKYTTQQEDTMSLKAVKIDGEEYQADGVVIKTLTDLQKKFDELMDKSKTDLSTIQGKLDSATEENIQIKKDMKDLSDKVPSLVADGIKSKIGLTETAIKAGIEVKADMSDEEIRKAIIIKAFPNSKEKLDKADSAYIQARYDSAVELLIKEDTNRTENTDSTSDLTHMDGKGEVSDSGKHREEMIKRLKGQETDTSKK